jgi:hypothetical protein
VLEGVSPQELGKFLWVFYNPTYSLCGVPIEDWEAIFKVANKYGFHRVKQLAVREVQNHPMSTVNRYLFYRKHNAEDKVLLDLLVDLCVQDPTFAASARTHLPPF